MVLYVYYFACFSTYVILQNIFLLKTFQKEKNGIGPTQKILIKSVWDAALASLFF